MKLTENDINLIKDTVEDVWNRNLNNLHDQIKFLVCSTAEGCLNDDHWHKADKELIMSRIIKNVQTDLPHNQFYGSVADSLFLVVAYTMRKVLEDKGLIQS